MARRRPVAPAPADEAVVDVGDMPESLCTFNRDDWEPGPVPPNLLAVMRGSAGGENPRSWRYYQQVRMWTEARAAWAADRGLTEDQLPGPRPRRILVIM